MGTDWVSLFDKGKCDEIRLLKCGDFAQFIERNFKDLIWQSLLFRGFGEDVSVSERLLKLRAQGVDDDALRVNLVNSLCVLEERVSLDYWGCYAEVFVTEPPGSIAERVLFPNAAEWHYLLLTSDNVGQILDSLEQHKDDLRVTSRDDLKRIREWRDTCAADSRYRVAYFFDF